ncbi:MAG: hypothetical protein WC804_07095 [Sphingomonas sp.]|jgi:hypothetical protein|uniref:hypothetical protein n=1 Tax=Sphingomonas sp. TaxID=28214 RepID=UPI0035673BA9
MDTIRLPWRPRRLRENEPTPGFEMQVTQRRRFHGHRQVSAWTTKHIVTSGPKIRARRDGRQNETE